MQVSFEKHKLYNSHWSIVYNIYKAIYLKKFQLQFHGVASWRLALFAVIYATTVLSILFLTHELIKTEIG